MVDVSDLDVVMVCSRDDLRNVLPHISYISQNLHPEYIIIICPSDTPPFVELQKFENVIILDEDTLYGGMTFSSISNIITDITGSSKYSGWYFQQFLKMAYAFSCSKSNYIVWDADTLPLRPLNFIDPDGSLLFTMKDEYHEQYFDIIKKLFGYGKVIEQSFIAEHMIINTEIMLKLLFQIEMNKSLGLYPFFEKILRAITPNNLINFGFSEFETYGTFVMQNYPEKYSLRKLKTCRRAKILLGSSPDQDVLIWASNDYDIVSFESWDHPLFFISILTKSSYFRKLFSMEQIYRHSLPLIQFQDRLYVSLCRVLSLVKL